MDAKIAIVFCRVRQEARLVQTYLLMVDLPRTTAKHLLLISHQDNTAKHHLQTPRQDITAKHHLLTPHPLGHIMANHLLLTPRQASTVKHHQRMLLEVRRTASTHHKPATKTHHQVCVILPPAFFYPPR